MGGYFCCICNEFSFIFCCLSIRSIQWTSITHSVAVDLTYRPQKWDEVRRLKLLIILSRLVFLHVFLFIWSITNQITRSSYTSKFPLFPLPIETLSEKIRYKKEIRWRYPVGVTWWVCNVWMTGCFQLWKAHRVTSTIWQELKKHFLFVATLLPLQRICEWHQVIHTSRCEYLNHSGRSRALENEAYISKGWSFR